MEECAGNGDALQGTAPQPMSAHGSAGRRWSLETTSGRPLAVGAAAGIALTLLFATLAWEVSRAGAAPLDKEITLAVHCLQAPVLTRIAQAVTFLGDWRLLIPATVIVAMGIVLGGRPVIAALFSGSVLGGWLLESLLKLLVHRARPNLWPALVIPKSYSFPSGHATMATLFYGGLVVVIFQVSRRRSVRVVVLLAALFLIGAIGFTRVYLGAHWASDVVAGLLVGLFWVVCCATGMESLVRRERDVDG